VHRVIDHYHPTHISFFTSESLVCEAQEFVSKLRDENISTRIIVVHPFHKDAITAVKTAMTTEFIALRKTYLPSNTDYYIGLTGGTNLMVLGAGFAAHDLGIRSHYILHPEFIEGTNTDLIVEPNLASMDENIENLS